MLSGDRSVEVVGGAEVQMCLLARAFAKAGHRVSMICLDYGQEDGIEIDGVRVLKAHTPDGGLPIVRFLYPRFFSIWQALGRADADIYYQRAAGVHTGFVAAFCRLRRRKFVFAAAHDADFDATCPLIRFARDKSIFRWGLRWATDIVVQNPTQKQLCAMAYKREALLVRSCYSPPYGAGNNRDGYVLWVSTLRRWKRPELFIELARRLPQYQFRMVGGGESQEYYAELQAQAKVVSNLDFVGFVPHADIDRQFDGARVFVNTSDHEGFPNTFLQAWARRVPCVSFVDTGSILDGRSVQYRVTGIEELTGTVLQLMSDEQMWCEAGQRSIRYFSEKHSVERAIEDYSEIFGRMMRMVDGQ